jgi:hypothetical protein
MASLDTTEVRETLEPWLEHAVRYWLDEYGEIGDPQGDRFLSELPTAEYVSIVHDHRGGVLIDCYPATRAACDDLYERLLAGFSIGGVLRIYKATGEHFTPREMKSVRAGIRLELLSVIASEEGDDNAWRLDMEAEGKWATGDFEGEDFERVVIVEANEFLPRGWKVVDSVPFWDSPEKTVQLIQRTKRKWHIYFSSNDTTQHSGNEGKRDATDAFEEWRGLWEAKRDGLID